MDWLNLVSYSDFEAGFLSKYEESLKFCEIESEGHYVHTELFLVAKDSQKKKVFCLKLMITISIGSVPFSNLEFSMLFRQSVLSNVVAIRSNQNKPGKEAGSPANF